MRNLVFTFLILSVFACANSSTDTANVAKAVVTSQPIKVAPIQKDTIKPEKKKSRFTMTDPARPIGEMNTTFPYDIALKDAKGNMLNSSDILKSNGKPTVVLFWLTTCFPCRLELIAIQKEIDAWKKETDFNIVAISTDFEKNYKNFVKRVDESKWSFDAYVDVNREFRKVMPGELNGLPQSFIFDKDGEIVYHSRKYSTGDEHKLYAKIKEVANSK